MAKKILVIAPHADDEILGCGGYLLSQKKEGAEIHVLFGTIGGSHKLQHLEERIKEARKATDAIGASFNIAYTNKDAELDTLGAKEIVTKIDSELDFFKPDEVFINYPSTHQDHIKIYECAMAAMRLRDGYFPKFVALYEYPFILNQSIEISGGKMFFNIEEYIDQKCNIFCDCYSSQVRGGMSPLNRDGIVELAKLRGKQCGSKYAELFYIQRMVL